MGAVVALITAPLGWRASSGIDVRRAAASLQRIMDQMWLDAEARHFAAWIKAEEQHILYGTGKDLPMGLLDLRRPWPVCDSVEGFGPERKMSPGIEAEES